MADDPLDANSETLNHASKIEEARRYLKNIVWLYETVSERGTAGKDGRRPKMRIQRFAQGAPRGCVRQVLDLLTDAAPYTDPVISGETIPGRWKPAASYFRKDSRYQTVDYRTATVTLVQDLVPDYEDGDSDAYPGGGDCSSVTEYEYFWDAPEVKAPEAPFPQGVSYAVGSVSRDEDSGLYSYYVAKRTAVPHQIGPYLGGKNAGGWTVVTQLMNQYSLPPGAEEEGGVQTSGSKTYQVRLNDDCTYDVTVTETFSSKRLAAETCQKELGKHEHVTREDGQENKLPEAPAAQDGVIVRNESQLEEDGTWRNTQAVTCETAVPNCSVTRQLSISGTTVTTVDKNMPKGTGASLAPGRVGETVHVVRTEGDLETVQRTVPGTLACDVELARGGAEDLRSSTFCRTVLSQSPLACTAGEGLVEFACDGKVHQASSALTETGTWRNTEAVAEEKLVECSQRTFERNFFGEKVTVATESADEPLADPASGDASVVNRKTEGGKYDTVSTVETRNNVKWRWTMASTPFETHVREVERAAASPRESAGHTSTVNLGVEKDGKYDIVTDTMAPACTVEVTQRVESWSETTVLEKTRNAASCATAVYEPGVHKEVLNKRNDYGLVDVTQTTETPKNAWTKTLWFSSEGATVGYLHFGRCQEVPGVPVPSVSGASSIKLVGVSSSVSRDAKYGLYSGTIQATYQVQYDSSSAPGDFIGTYAEHMDVTVTEIKSYNGVPYKVVYTATKYEGITSYVEQAYQFITSTGSGSLAGVFDPPTVTAVQLGGHAAMSGKYSFYNNISASWSQITPDANGAPAGAVAV